MQYCPNGRHDKPPLPTNKRTDEQINKMTSPSRKASAFAAGHNKLCIAYILTKGDINVPLRDKRSHKQKPTKAENEIKTGTAA